MNTLSQQEGFRTQHTSYSIDLTDGHVYARTHRPAMVEYQNGKLHREIVLNDTGVICGFERLTRDEAKTLFIKGQRISLPVLGMEKPLPVLNPCEPQATAATAG